MTSTSQRIRATSDNLKSLEESRNRFEQRRNDSRLGIEDRKQASTRMRAIDSTITRERSTLTALLVTSNTER